MGSRQRQVAFFINLQIATYLQMQTLLSDLTKYLEEETTVETCPRIKDIAEEFYQENLTFFVEEYIRIHFKDYSAIEHFNSLSYNEVCRTCYNHRLLFHLVTIMVNESR